MPRGSAATRAAVPDDGEAVDLPPIAGARRGLSFLFASRVFRGLAAGLVTLGVPYLVLVDLQVGAFVLGVLYFAGALSTALLTYALGRLGSRRALRGTYLLALALLPVATGILLLPGTTIWTVLLASILGGFSATGSLAGGGVGGAAYPLQLAVLSDLTPPDRRTRWISWFTFVAGMAASFGALAAQGGSLTDVFALAFGLSIASVLAAVPIPVRPVRRGRRPGVASRRVILRFTATGVLNGVSQGLLTPFLIPFFVLAYGVTRSDMAIYTSIGSILGTVSVLSAPLLERRYGFVRAIVGTRSVTAVLAVLIPFVSLAPALLFYVMMPMFRVAALPAQSSALMGRLPGADRSEGAGTNQSARVGAASASTLFAGYSFEDLALAVPFVGYAAAVVANAALYVRFFGWNGEKIPTLAPASKLP